MLVVVGRVVWWRDRQMARVPTGLYVAAPSSVSDLETVDRQISTHAICQHRVCELFTNGMPLLRYWVQPPVDSSRQLIDGFVHGVCTGHQRKVHLGIVDQT